MTDSTAQLEVFVMMTLQRSGPDLGVHAGAVGTGFGPESRWPVTARLVK